METRRTAQGDFATRGFAVTEVSSDKFDRFWRSHRIGLWGSGESLPFPTWIRDLIPTGAIRAFVFAAGDNVEAFALGGWLPEAALTGPESSFGPNFADVARDGSRARARRIFGIHGVESPTVEVAGELLERIVEKLLAEDATLTRDTLAVVWRVPTEKPKMVEGSFRAAPCRARVRMAGIAGRSLVSADICWMPDWFRIPAHGTPARMIDLPTTEVLPTDVPSSTLLRISPATDEDPKLRVQKQGAIDEQLFAACTPLRTAGQRITHAYVIEGRLHLYVE